MISLYYSGVVMCSSFASHLTKKSTLPQLQFDKQPPRNPKANGLVSIDCTYDLYPYQDFFTKQVKMYGPINTILIIFVSLSDQRILQPLTRYIPIT